MVWQLVKMRLFDRHFSGKRAISGAVVILAFGWLGTAGILGDVLPQARERASAIYQQARSNYMAFPASAEVAARLSRACFEFAELSTDNQARSALAEEGIGAARFATTNAPHLGAGYLYLGLNQGELARTKLLGALPLLRQMEKALLRASELDAQLDYAGADRSLGQLYLEAPGWPASIGNKKKARAHLSQSIKLVPDYPDNHLSFMEALVRWNEKEPLSTAIKTYRELLPQARKKYAGIEWDQAWHDWEERWQAILKASDEEK